MTAAFGASTYERISFDASSLKLGSMLGSSAIRTGVLIGYHRSAVPIGHDAFLGHLPQFIRSGA
jgi:hypothetical protein